MHAWRPNDDVLQRKNIFILNKTTISLDLCVYTCIGWIIIDQNYKCDIEQNEFKQVKNNKNAIKYKIEKIRFYFNFHYVFDDLFDLRIY